ncbi:lipopolysaccharide assembly protein LapA domain-containing protein [Gayadomonas joobiniege]|uniref:lipopolysaccharide assembly protein LapA domain-containing protein n=1 Tax=Gayadomonas joobiniege TaxID=1234606 RepID=UPI00035EDA8A|nr:LapA family protein [Gayadomonas joobiniege]
MKNAFYLIIIFLFSVFLLLMSAYNTTEVELNYLLAVQSMPLAVALSIYLLAGLLLASFIWLFYLLKVKIQLQTKNRKINKLNREIELLRLQLKDQ